MVAHSWFINRLTTEEPVMPAEIIPFKPRSAPATSDSDNRARLRRAFSGLDEANRRQREAVANWRHALAELRTSMQNLDNSMQRYSLRLASLRAGVDGVREEALKLERHADVRFAKE